MTKRDTLIRRSLLMKAPRAVAEALGAAGVKAEADLTINGGVGDECGSPSFIIIACAISASA